jgi:signal transduction histidine kinase
VALSMQLEAVQRLYPVDPERASVQVDEMKRLTRDSMALLRQTLEGLRLPGLDGQALTTALPRLCADFSTRTGLSVQCEVDPATDNLRPAVSETLWRISQEALANIERHAQASVVALRLRVMPDAVFLYINDDGIGLPPGAETRPGHYGLRGMRERVEGLGGTLNIESENGTRLTARLPRA